MSRRRRDFDLQGGLRAVPRDHAAAARPAGRPGGAQPPAGALGEAGADPSGLHRQARARPRAQPHRPLQPAVLRRHLRQRRRRAIR